MTPRRRSPSLNERELRLWKVRRALVLAFVAAVLVAGGVFYGLVVLLDFQEIDTTTKLDAKTLFDLVKLSFGVVAGAGALVALVVAYRRQRVDEAGAHREATRLHTERFSQAVDKLGSDSPAVRLGGVHALAGLADDAPTRELRQTCIDVLCAYIRLPYTTQADLPAGDADARRTYLSFREVRHTVLRLVRDHLRLPREHHSWVGHDFDFTDAVFDGGDFSGATFSGGRVSFSGATFSGGRVSFSNATFSGSKVDFYDAKFSGGEVDFHGATFSGGKVSFHGATFSGSTVPFSVATFSGGEVSFFKVMFSGSTVSFFDATFSGGEVSFFMATFSGGEVSFSHATFCGSEATFSMATFSGSTVGFDSARGPAPRGLLDAVGTPAPAEVVLPSAWLPPVP
ncbi:pentapeptide repeat-containing protein [Streptomyces sp. NBC_00053]|uniref:pentapeptide repeat-containing protein n=1 Tax=unclassified Streptomyces TaxID=2593676 RepID=UPI00224CEB98|nr:MULTISPECIES: pentapeptide repeat-containing protein [unclassified Streptomyces]MCX5497882.1 pentapeptide repeat-containing protein [Streptomyces sp. NBC_00052]MCX5553589.1 pentapeptide repeat-containing protein [Streptomyces sp. NBC_00051]